MIKKTILLIILLSLLIGSVSAVVVNTTALFPTSYDYTISQDGALNTKSYIFTAPSGYVIGLSTIHLASGWISDGTAYFTFKTVTGTTINGKIISESGILSSKLKPSFTGGTTASSGSNFFGIGTLCPPISFFYAYSDSTSKWYFIAAESSRLNFNPQQVGRTGTVGQFSLDTVNDAYIELSTSPTGNPYKDWDAQSTMTFTTQTFYEKLVALKDQESDTIIYAEGGTPNDMGGMIAKVIEIISAILKAGYQLIEMGATVGIYFISGALFLFAGTIVLTLFAAYTIIAAVLSIHDSDDMFRSIGKFYRYEMKLWDFFTIKLYKVAKEIIKWW